MKRAVLAALLVLTGCTRPVIQVVSVAHVADLPQGAIHQVGMPTEYVELHLHYQEEIKPGIVLDSESQQTTFIALVENGVAFNDSLTQTGGQRVDFDCDHVADKILDRDLVPIVQRECKSIHEVAVDVWMHHPPKEFLDDKGRIWREISETERAAEQTTKDAKCTIDYGPIVVDSKGKLVEDIDHAMRGGSVP